MTDEQPESSPATEQKAEPQAPPESEKPDASVGIFDEPEKTAKAEETPEEAAPSEPASEKDETETASEAEKRSDESEEPRKESKAEKRIKQLTAQVKALERQMGDAQRPNQPVPPNLKEPQPPDLETFQGTAEEFKKAQEQYSKDVREFAIQQDRIVQQRNRAQAEQQKRDAEAKTNWDRRQARILKENPEFNPVDILKVVQPNPTTDGFLVDSEAGPEILNHLYENPDEADRIRSLSPYQAVRELIKLEGSYLEKIKGVKSKPVPPKPPKQVKGQQSGPSKPRLAEDILYG